MNSKESARTVVVTGASSGIGLEIARLFARDGYQLVLVARRQAELERLAGELASAGAEKVRVFAKDLALPDTAREIYDALQGTPVDVLVNNAGVGTNGPFAEADLDAEMRVIQLNIASLTHLTGLLLPGMIQRKSGRILNVASTAAFQPGPLMAVYYASKGYVLMFSEALAEELIGTGVTVTTLCPGPTRSEFQARAKMETSRLVHGPLGLADAATVAQAGYAGLMRGKRIVIPGLMNKLVAQSYRFSPRRLVTIVAKYLNGAPPGDRMAGRGASS